MRFHRTLFPSLAVVTVGVVVLRCGGSGTDDGTDASTSDSASNTDSAADVSTKADAGLTDSALDTGDASTAPDSSDASSAPDSSCTGAGQCDSVNFCPSSQQCCKTAPEDPCGFCFKGSICPP